MKKHLISLLILIGAIALATTTKAADTPASEATIREMLRVSDVHKLVDSMFPQIEQVMRGGMQQALQARELKPEEQQALDKFTAKMMATFRQELSWEKLEPMYIEIYQKSFTEEELQGIIAFYKTPAGVAMVKKMPVVMQQAMATMQQRMGPIMQRMQASIQEMVGDLEKGSSEKP